MLDSNNLERAKRIVELLKILKNQRTATSICSIEMQAYSGRVMARTSDVTRENILKLIHEGLDADIAALKREAAQIDLRLPAD